MLIIRLCIICCKYIFFAVPDLRPLDILGKILEAKCVFNMAHWIDTAKKSCDLKLICHAFEFPQKEGYQYSLSWVTVLQKFEMIIEKLALLCVTDKEDFKKKSENITQL